MRPVPGRVLFGGKVVDLERQTTAGFARGTLTIEGMESCAGETLVIEFQNENLIARRDGVNRVHSARPDLRRRHGRRRAGHDRDDALRSQGDHTGLPGTGALDHS